MISSVYSLKQLEAFVWAVDLGSFRKAAQHLNTTQPNISSRIAKLEATLDVVLMLRDSNSVRLTEHGAEILRRARKVLREAEGVLEVANRKDLIEDRLRLGVTELVACTWLHDYLRQLKAIYPALAVELTVDLSRKLDKELGQNTLDLTIQTAPFETPVDGNIELGRFPYVWVTANGAGLKNAGRLSLKDLMGDIILTHARHTQAVTELTLHAQTQSLPTTRFAASNSISSCVQMVLDGMGVALLPKVLVDEHLLDGSLFLLDVNWTPSPLSFAARFHAAKASGFVKHAADLAAQVATEFERLHDGRPPRAG